MKIKDFLGSVDFFAKNAIELLPAQRTAKAFRATTSFRNKQVNVESTFY